MEDSSENSFKDKTNWEHARYCQKSNRKIEWGYLLKWRFILYM